MGWLLAGGAGPGGGGAGGGLKGTRACWVTSWVTMEVSRTLTTLWILLAVTQLPGKAEGEARHLATPLTPSSGAPSLPGPRTPDAVYVEGKQPGHQIPNLPYLRPHLDASPHAPFPHQWDNDSYHHRHRIPQQPSYHLNHHHHYSHHNHHPHRWEIEGGGAEKDEEEEEAERIEDGKNVNGEGISSRFSVSSSHHHHKHHRQKQMPQPTLRRRSSTSPAQGEAGGYAFRVDEKSGVRRVIAVREVAGRGSRAVVDSSASGGSGEIARLLDLPQDDSTVGPPPGPSFDRNLPRNITIQTGQTAVLSCRVFNVNDKSVSWIRQENLHILTVDKYKYSTDQRVSVVFNEPNLEWVLRIKSVTPADAGTYECQVSTKPILSFVVNMRVVDKLPTPTATPTPMPAPSQEVMMKKDEEDAAQERHNTSKVPRAWILNAPEIYVHRGSPINLTCVVTHGTERPVFIYWYHHDQVIDYEGRGGVRVHTQNGRDTVSHLLVKKAGPGDTGRYTCSPSNGEPASVMLHVLNGEHQAAMQTNGGIPLAGPRGALWHLLLLLLALLHALPRPQLLRL